jgi:hypothetical protein
MSSWLAALKYNPIQPLAQNRCRAVSFFANRDLLNLPAGRIEDIWNLTEVKKSLRAQRSDGSWGSSKKANDSGTNYSLIETWKAFRFLIEQFQLTKKHDGVENASEYLFSCQSNEGDIRGILANQYAPYYTGAILYLLIKAGYQDDSRVKKGLEWLLKMRQHDGGWVIGSPGLINRNWKEVYKLTSEWTEEPARDFDWSKPFSAAGTGMVLRAFSVHPLYKKSSECLKAAFLLKSKLFKEDNWSSYQHPDNWLRFQFPFWWTNIVSVLDTFSLIGISREDKDIANALHWLLSNQQSDGLWKISYSKIHKAPTNSKTDDMRSWISLCICRILKSYFSDNRAE